MSEKTRVVLSIDKDVWKHMQHVLKENGYPRGTASMLVQRTFEDAIETLEETGSIPQLVLFR